MKIYRNYNLS